MGTDPGESGAPAVTVATGDAAALRRQIEATREELGDTVAALAVKADVRQQARERVEEVRRRARDRMTATRRRALERRDALLGRADGASPRTTEAVTHASRSAAAQASAHPLPVAVAGAVAVGFLLGRRASR